MTHTMKLVKTTPRSTHSGNFAGYDVFVDKVKVGELRGEGGLSRLKDIKPHHVFYGVDGSKNGSVAIKGPWRGELFKSAVKVFEGMQ